MLLFRVSLCSPQLGKQNVLSWFLTEGGKNQHIFVYTWTRKPFRPKSSYSSNFCSYKDSTALLLITLQAAPFESNYTSSITVFNIQHVIVPFSEHSTIIKSFYSIESFTDSLVFPVFLLVPAALRHDCWIRTPHTTEYCSHFHVMFVQTVTILVAFDAFSTWSLLMVKSCLFWNRQRWGLCIVDSWHLGLSSAAFVVFHPSCQFLMRTHQVNTFRQWL